MGLPGALTKRPRSLESRCVSRLEVSVNTNRQGEWGELSDQGATVTKKGLLTVVTEARDRHSVLQVAAPLEFDVQDPVHLKDTQACQVRRTPTFLVSPWVSL